jgi:hypothetical protein
VALQAATALIRFFPPLHQLEEVAVEAILLLMLEIMAALAAAAEVLDTPQRELGIPHRHHHHKGQMAA